MNIGWGIIVGGALLAASIAISHRYEMSSFASTGGYVGLWRADNLTGEILFCDKSDTAPAACKPATIYK